MCLPGSIYQASITQKTFGRSGAHSVYKGSIAIKGIKCRVLSLPMLSLLSNLASAERKGALGHISKLGSG